MKLESVFKTLTFATRMAGIFPYDEKGRPTGRFAITLTFLVITSLGQILYWGNSNALKFLKDRPFSLLVSAIESFSLLASFACYAIEKRSLINLEKLQAFEKQNKLSIDYGIKWMIFNIYGFPLYLISKYIFYVWSYGWRDSLPRILRFIMPRIITQLGAMYYCCILRIIHKQLCALSKSKITAQQKMVWHSHLIGICNSIQEKFRFRLIFGVLFIIIGSIRCEMQISEGYLTCLDTGGIFCSKYLFAALVSELLDLAWTLHSLTQTCYHVKTQAAKCFQDVMELQIMKIKPQTDVRLLVYASRVPQFNTNVDDFFDISPNLFLKIATQSVIFYLLMLQMKVIRSWSE